MQAEKIFEIAYILKGFPRLSETFISNEISLLEEKGLRIQVFSVKQPQESKVHSKVKQLAAPISYLPNTTSLSNCNLINWLVENIPNFAKAHIRLLGVKPLPWFQTFFQMIVMCFKYRDDFLSKPKKVFIKEFLQAGHIALPILRSGNIKRLHGHFSHGSTTITWFVSKLTGIPFSFTAHAKDIYQKKLNPGDLLKKKLDAADFVVTCTEANKQYLQDLCEDDKKVNTIYHGLDTKFFVPVENENSDQTPLILSVGRFVEKKGFVFLIEACRKLKDLGVEFQCQIIGEKGEQFELIQQMIGSLDLMDTVTLKNEMTQNELKSVYLKTTLFALPCQITGDGDRDGIPNVLVEAMAMGIPVVSTNISGIPELIRHGVNGMLVPQKNSDALARSLKKLLQDEDQRKKLSLASRRTVCQSFDSHETSCNLKQLFDSTLQQEMSA